MNHHTVLLLSVLQDMVASSLFDWLLGTISAVCQVAVALYVLDHDVHDLLAHCPGKAA